MFLVSKLVALAIDPGLILFGLLLLGGLLSLSGVTGRRRAGKSLLTLGVLLTCVVTVLPVGHWLMQPLEERFPRARLPAEVAGIVVLGAAVDAGLSAARGVPAVGDAAERLFALASLARQYPKATLIFTGGSGDPWNPADREAPVVHGLLESLGVDTGRILWDAEARNTQENAERALDLAQAPGLGTWLLVTSAAHMPRAIGVFRSLGWSPQAYPVDYRTPPGPAPALPMLDLTTNLRLIGIGLKEWVGLVAYYLLDRTDTVFPAPLPPGPLGARPAVGPAAGWRDRIRPVSPAD